MSERLADGSVLLPGGRVLPPPHVVDAPSDSIAGFHLKRISPLLSLKLNKKLGRYEIWNDRGMVIRVTKPGGGYAEPALWLIKELQLPFDAQVRAMDERNRLLREEQRRQRDRELEAMTSDRWWQKGFVAFLTRDFSFVDKVFHVRVPWKRAPGKEGQK